MSASPSKSAFYRRHIRSASLSLGKPVISPARHSTSSVIPALTQAPPAPVCGTPTRHRRNASAFTTFSVKPIYSSPAPRTIPGTPVMTNFELSSSLDKMVAHESLVNAAPSSQQVGPCAGTPSKQMDVNMSIWSGAASSRGFVQQMLFSTVAASKVSQEQLSSHIASLISDADETPAEGALAKPMEATKGPQTLNLPPAHPMYRLHLLVGCVTSTTPHPTAPHLWVHTIRLSSSATCERTILSGLKKFYPNGDEMTGKTVVVVANLPAKKLRGIKSEGMILCGVREDEGGEVVRLLEPPTEARVGERVVVEGMVLPGTAQIHAVEAAETASGKIPAAAPLPPKVLGKKETVWEEIVGGFTVGNDSLGRWDGRKLYIEGKGECFCPGVEGGKIC
ncbi:nucleic acid-binding protein [Saitoella complicata NRRL Y-17804]|nr:nucleic acid-binding protein [Saitoella complicata NRRL Y-17804]ODQ56072.1 nucleic acid-binding protein [Saitoella complicata NRRL Y-17804]